MIVSESQKHAVLMYDGDSTCYAGAEVFFINLATSLASLGYRLTLVDIEGSVVVRVLQEKGIAFDFVPFQKKKHLSICRRADYLVVTNSKVFHCTRLALNPDCKVLVVEIDKEFWADAPAGWLSFRHVANWTKRRWRQYLIDGAGIAVLEESARSLASQRGYRRAERMSRVPLFVPDVLSRTRRHEKGTPWHFFGVARDALYKITPLAHFFPKIRRIFPDARFTFVTHNPQHAADLFRQMGVDFVECVAGCPPDALNTLLSQSADCVMAMGTTAINAAALGIPTLVADPSNDWPYPADRVRWFHANGDNLGEYVTHDMATPPEGISVEQAMSDLVENEDGLSVAARSFYEREHSVTTFTNAIVKALERTEIRFGAYAFRTRCTVVR